MEINPKHPLIKQMLTKVNVGPPGRFTSHPHAFMSNRRRLVLQEDGEDKTAEDLAMVLFETATLRSGYQLADTKAYGDRIERMLRLSMNVAADEQVTPSQRWVRPGSTLLVSNLLLLVQVDEEPEEEPAEEDSEDKEDDSEEMEKVEDDDDEETVKG